MVSVGGGARAVAEDVAHVALRASEAEAQLQVACGLALDVGLAQAGRKAWNRRMEIANALLRSRIRELQHLVAKLFAERRAYRAGVDAALEEMRAVVRRNEELATALGLMTRRAAIADELLGSDASGSALSVTLDYAAGLLGRADLGEGLFVEMLRKKAELVRTLAACPGGPAPKDESAVPDAPSYPDGHTPHGGEVFALATVELAIAARKASP